MYCGLRDHTGREHIQFVVSLSDKECPGCGDEAEIILPCTVCGRQP